MNDSGIMVTLITVVFGLMLTELFAGVHRLLRARRRVRWDWITLLVAWYVFMTVLKNWWELAFGAGSSLVYGGWVFLYYGHLFLLLYLVASAVLPDEVPAAGLDLRAFYLESAGHFWGLFAGVNLMLLLYTVLTTVLTSREMFWPAIASNVVMIMVALSLSLIRRQRYHAVVVCILVGLMVLEVVMKF